MLDLLKSLNIVRLDDVAGKVRFAVTTTELDRRETGGFGVTVVRTFEQVAQVRDRRKLLPPDYDSPEFTNALTSHVQSATAAAALSQLETPPGDPPPPEPGSGDALTEPEQADKAAKVLSATEQQAELAAKLQAAQQQGFTW